MLTTSAFAPHDEHCAFSFRPSVIQQPSQGRSTPLLSDGLSAFYSRKISVLAALSDNLSPVLKSVTDDGDAADPTADLAMTDDGLVTNRGAGSMSGSEGRDGGLSAAVGDGVGDVKCQLCEALVVWIMNQLARNKTRDEIMKHLYNVSD